jgi:probable HAF family extracellular repeat protein
MRRIAWRITHALIAGALLSAFALIAQAHAKPYPYTLIDPGTFGGPSSYLDLPGVPITPNGAVLGTADTTTPDPDLPAGGFSDVYVQHAFAWTNGHLADLGALAPAATNNSQIYELNGNGIGAGGSENGVTDPLTGLPAQEATIFEHGQVIGVGTLGGYESFAQDITSNGQVAGISSNDTIDPLPSEQQYYFPWVDEIRGFVWQAGVMHDLGTLGGPDAQSYIQNQRGQIAGWSDTNATLNATGAPTIDPFLWRDGHMTDLGGLGGTLGFVNWLNDKGEVVGQSDLPGDQTWHPYLWNGRRMIDLGTLGGNFGMADYVNNRGDVSGWSTTAGDQGVDGFLWHNGKMIDLPVVGDAALAFGNAVNNLDQVVGNENDANNNEVIAALWSGGHGYDLNTLVAPSSFQMISADYINDQGTIFGHGVYTSGPNAGDARVFVLTRNPSVPLPAASAPRRPVRRIARQDVVRLAVRLAHSAGIPAPMRWLPFDQSP